MRDPDLRFQYLTWCPLNTICLRVNVTPVRDDEAGRPGWVARSAVGPSWRASATALIGRDHGLLGRNGQDHAVARSMGASAVVAVADGCGEARGSEVGARLSVAVALRLLGPKRVGCGQLDDLVAEVGREVRRVLRTVAIDVAGDEAPAFAAEHLAATLLVGVARGAEALVFGWGDGLYRHDDRVVTVDEGGHPRYLAVDLFRDLTPRASFTERVDGARLIAVATDGFDEGALAELPAARSTALLRWMRVRTRSGAFSDDGAVGLITETQGDEREGA